MLSGTRNQNMVATTPNARSVRSTNSSQPPKFSHLTPQPSRAGTPAGKSLSRALPVRLTVHSQSCAPAVARKSVHGRMSRLSRWLGSSITIVDGAGAVPNPGAQKSLRTVSFSRRVR
jgi:hypothetical protein